MHSLPLLLLVVGLVLAQGHTAVAQYESPAFHMGETIPVTVYMRLERQSRGLLAYITGNGGDDAAADLGSGVAAAMRAPAKEEEWDEDLEDAFMAANQHGAAGVLKLHSEADMIGVKHARQRARLIPPQQAPRFGISKLASLPAEAMYKRAATQMKMEPTEDESALALRLSIGKGFNRETTWVPVATRLSRLREGALFNFLTPDLQQEVREILERQSVGDQDAEDPAAAAAAAADDKGENKLFYLANVNFFFGFQVGMLNRMTSMRYEFDYSAKRPKELTLTYFWEEHRAYNTHLAITVCCAVAVATALGMFFSIVGCHTGKAAKSFRKRTVTVRPRTD